MIHKAELPQGNRWNHVKVSIKSNTQETKSGRDQFDLALHVCKQQNNLDTLRFMDPRKVYADSNSWPRVQQPQDCEELENDVPYRDLAVFNLKAQRLPKEDIMVKRVILPSRWTYDVFLSYRGDDECSNFVCLLFNSLRQRGIHVFRNDELVKTSREELKAIQESRTAIIVISNNYASSPSCLNNLTIIHECFRMECRFIYPIFYDVEPLELQHQIGSYGEVFARLEKIFKQHVQKWRLALSEVAGSRDMFNLSPRLITNAIEDEDIAHLITHEVSTRIEEFPFHFKYFLVGLESWVQNIISLMDIRSSDEIKMVGICGGRMHISIMARSVCNSIACHFEDLWYFHGVGEAARGYDSTWDDFHKWITQPCSPQRKILLILEIHDGAKELDQLRAVREYARFGEGSRIIVVARDKQLLVSHGVKIIYDGEWNSTLDEKGKTPKEEDDLKEKQAVMPFGWTCDVFLSYRGGDECSSFVHRLYNSLCQRGVRAFVDDELFKTSQEKLKAMQGSRIAIIVISKNYASSPCCLNSLAIIQEFFKKEHRFIYPIFYNVKPYELHSLGGISREVFARLEKIFKQRVQKWRSAMFKAIERRGVNRSTRLFTNATQDEDVVQLTTHEVSARIEQFPFHFEYFSVGLESQVQNIISLMDIRSNKEVKMVGICGDRMRRSIMARSVCNSIARHFEDLWYFHGFLEAARGYDSTWYDFYKWITQPCFLQRKILLILEILDGAEELDQLGAVRECDQFDEGSMIIVVTRDKQFLVSHGVKIIYDDEWNSALDEKGKNPKEEGYLKAKRAVLPFGWTYDVFLSHRGGDQCSSFVRRLYNSLCQRGVRAFVDDELVKTSQENLKAMQESRTAVIVISKNYASSDSCLNSLAIIHEYFNMERQFFCPIFYDVEPLELQHQTGSYREVFDRLEKIFKQHVQKWRLALSEVANSRDMLNLCTRLVTNAIEDEDVVQWITHEVCARIEKFPFHVDYFSTRLESQVQKIISLVDIGSNKEVKMVGICGKQKSAITLTVCNVIARHFEDLWYFSSSSIFPWTKNDFSHPIKLLFPIYEKARGGYGFTLDDFHNLIRQPWFPQKKNLIILDGVEGLDQLESIRECDRFGEGSRIIVVTGDKQLVSHGVEIIYNDEWNSALDEKGKNPKEEGYLKAKRAVLPSGWTYDVFLSYRSDDECSSFVRRLYNSLCRRGVCVFVNDELVKTSQENLKVIQKSRIAIIVISKNYASSPCCLNSLAIIHDCFRMECRFIYPIFYDVVPVELLHQTRSYGEVFARLEKIFKQHVQKWRLALSEVANSRDMFHLNTRFFRNSTVDEERTITGNVYARLAKFPFSVRDDLGELYESQVQEVISLMDVDEGVQMVGICCSGISTITPAVCNYIAHHFEDLWYFHGAHETARGHTSTWNDFQNWMTQPWFPQRKILVILDGAKELDQLRAIRECDRFGEGSMIIVTSSDKNFLVTNGIRIIMDEMEEDPNDQRHKLREKIKKRKREDILESLNITKCFKGGRSVTWFATFRS
ncbi:hypothetical protein K1719_027661 [Acacia pycnantha]|nr:hypothetical protein K1719_027661 [Acacia pycnantha]